MSVLFRCKPKNAKKTSKIFKKIFAGLRPAPGQGSRPGPRIKTPHPPWLALPVPGAGGTSGGEVTSRGDGDGGNGDDGGGEGDGDGGEGEGGGGEGDGSGATGTGGVGEDGGTSGGEVTSRGDGDGGNSGGGSGGEGTSGGGAKHTATLKSMSQPLGYSLAHA